MLHMQRVIVRAAVPIYLILRPFQLQKSDN